MKALVGAFNQEKAQVGAFSVIVQPVVEPMDRFTALVQVWAGGQYEAGREAWTAWDTGRDVEVVASHRYDI